MATSVYNTVKSPLTALSQRAKITPLPQATFNFSLCCERIRFSSSLRGWDRGLPAGHMAGLPARLMAGKPASGGGIVRELLQIGGKNL
jgi:hypothetical protein